MLTWIKGLRFANYRRTASSNFCNANADGAWT
jgi:hypothetical protein